ncbi:MAG TPA: hypothetical protein H9717_01055 [Candidatus Eisenbergiella merdipullorum]|uniref:DUF3307 domain-containing protein n=1 Tax=Candidatus Eisenbergiella merdipullorum TaxID=2838553 RepID=A0A9D2I3L1_9FIRM|nr:hypothetical protein [Candidatus Eisenbergiella merdipullorum]
MILLIVYFMYNTNIISTYRYDLFKLTNIFNLPGSAILAWSLKFLLLYKPANILIVYLLQSYKPDSKDDKKEENDKQAGRFIGVLERLIMAILISIDQYSAVGLVLTAKSIARYDRISKDPAFSEYYLLGTLLSVLIAIGVSLTF